VRESLRRSAAHVVVDDVSTPQLTADSLHHLGRVLRLHRGEAVTVTDGSGRWRPTEFTGTGVEATGEVVAEQRPQPTLTIAVAPPKGDRLDWLVAKCTEVGIDRILLLEAERSVVRWPGARAARQLDRLRRVATDAASQSRRVWLPELAGPAEALDVLPGFVAAEPGGRPLRADDAAVAVGPEGGWSAKELDAAAGAVSLGCNVLRVETAAVAAAVLMLNNRANR
jgi:16S rRNA (uracil1498-N3)-methyltransferase